jgi:murein DD-endopeptidase MepM/ murein hydrolase activator NlpD
MDGTVTGTMWADFRSIAAVLAMLVLAGAPPLGAADALRLDLPVRCAIGEDCWVVNYVDLDPGREARDYRCGRVTYDGHKGTDIAIRDLVAMQAGVAVVAAAAGEVQGTRDGVDDVDVERVGRDAIKGRECGNGVVLGHGDGWTSQYCHLRKGSVRVKKGERVAAGQMLGFVGNSGLAEFPHVHLQVAKDGRIVDPFVGVAGGPNCGIGEQPLWKPEVLAKLAYRPTALYNAGFAAAAPKPDAVRSGLHADKALSRQAPALVLWVDIFWAMPGDELSLRIVGPDGEVVAEHTSRLEKQEARRLAYAGAKRKKIFWDVGTYRGEIRLVRATPTREEYTTTREVAIK